MTDQKPEKFSDQRLNNLAETIMETLAAQFPVCMASDEFHFFPQAIFKHVQGSHWDDFSPDAIKDALGQMKRWINVLDQILSRPASFSQAVEASMLHRVLKTLGEQFEYAKVQETQPTFYLTIVGIGLAEAAESGDRAWTERLERLPDFLDQSRRNLIRLPRLFRDIGLEMLVQQRAWLHSLNVPGRCRGPIFAALERLQAHLEKAPIHETFLPDTDLYERIAADHMGCSLTPDNIAHELEMEIAETQSILEQAAEDRQPGSSWQAVIRNLPTPVMPEGGITQLYRNTISELAMHCKGQRLATEDLVRQCPITVEPIPDYMRPVRSNAAYSMPPCHPPAGGTFFILESGKNAAIPADYQLLTAHETFPGHHLLDTCRWQQGNVIRRHIEFPIFYEGWASFAEELMFETGFFSGSENRLLMAKRRFWRAVRGQIDFDIHMRRRTLDEAASLLTSTGMRQHRAIAMVRRYCLKPGYQLSYTIGRRRFHQLYKAWCRKMSPPALFARQILAQGEIGFHYLKQILIPKPSDCQAYRKYKEDLFSLS